MSVRFLRAMVLGLVTLAAAWAVLALSRAPLTDGWVLLHDVDVHGRSTPSADPVTTTVAAVCALALCGVTCWAVLAIAVCSGEALRNPQAHIAPSTRDARPSSVLRPRFLQLAVGGALGVGLVAGPSAYAAPLSPVPISGPETGHTDVRPGLPPDLRPDQRSDPHLRQHLHPHLDRLGPLLDGLPLPDRAVGVGRTQPPTARPDAVRSGARQPARQPTRLPDVAHVRPGDSLWTITARVLPDDASEADISSGWRLIYVANRTRIGPDPNLISSGLTLDIPSDLPAPTSGGHQ